VIEQNISVCLLLSTECDEIGISKSKLIVCVCGEEEGSRLLTEVQPPYLLAVFHEIYSAVKS